MWAPFFRPAVNQPQSAILICPGHLPSTRDATQVSSLEHKGQMRETESHLLLPDWAGDQGWGSWHSQRGPGCASPLFLPVSLPFPPHGAQPVAGLLCNQWPPTGAGPSWVSTAGSGAKPWPLGWGQGRGGCRPQDRVCLIRAVAQVWILALKLSNGGLPAAQIPQGAAGAFTPHCSEEIRPVRA